METLREEIRQNRAYIAVTVAGLAMAAYHMLSTQVMLQAAKAHSNTHLGFCLLVIYLGGFASEKAKFQRFWSLGLALLALACSGYVSCCGRSWKTGHISIPASIW